MLAKCLLNEFRTTLRYLDLRCLQDSTIFVQWKNTFVTFPCATFSGYVVTQVSPSILFEILFQTVGCLCTAALHLLQCIRPVRAASFFLLQVPIGVERSGALATIRIARAVSFAGREGGNGTEEACCEGLEGREAGCNDSNIQLDPESNCQS